MTILLHHLNFSRSDRLFWVLELGLPYDVRVHYRTVEGKGPETLKEVSPFGKAPVIEIDGKVRTESGFIVHLLLSAHQHPGVERTASDNSIFWSHFAEGSLMLNLQAAFTAAKVTDGFYSFKLLYLLPFFLMGVSALNKFLQRIARDNINPQLAEVEKFLTQHENFSGTSDVGEGDFLMFFPLNSIAAGSRKGQFDLGPNTQAWIDRIKSRPAWKKAMQRLKAEEEAQSSGRPTVKW